MKIQIPKHIRQCGETDAAGMPEELTEKIYMEDYVVTFFRQARDRQRDGRLTLELYGRKMQEEGKTCFLVYAAGMPEDAGRFSEYERLGQAHFSPGKKPEEYITEIQQEWNSIHAIMDRENENLTFYINQDGYVKRADLYFVFYEQNEAMQNFLIDWYRRSLKPEVTEPSDQAAHDFRRLYRERQDELHQNKVVRLMYAASLMLMILCCITGISMINQYDKMKQMGQSIDHLALAMEERKLPELSYDNEEYYNPVTDNAAYVKEDKVIEETQETEGALVESGEKEEETAVQAMSQNVRTVLPEKTEPQQKSEQEKTEPQQKTGQAEPEFYIVKEGDTLAQISRNLYGTSSRLVDLCELNQIEDPNNIIVGQKILLPQE